VGEATANLTKTADDSIDISDYEENGSIYLFVYIPENEGDITSFSLKVGSDNANYYSDTTTTTAEGLSFASGWNLLKFGLATETGTADMENIDYYQFTVTKSALMDSTTDFRIDNLLILMGNLFQTVYYSEYPWVDTDGVRKENSTLDSDTLALDSDETEIVMDKLNEKIAKALKRTKRPIL